MVNEKLTLAHLQRFVQQFQQIAKKFLFFILLTLTVGQLRDSRRSRSKFILGVRAQSDPHFIVVQNQSIELPQPILKLVGNLPTRNALDVVLNPLETSAYVADGSGGLLTVDITNKSNPLVQKISFVNSGSAYTVTLNQQGSTLYAGSGDTAFSILNVSTPANPVLRETRSFPNANIRKIILNKAGTLAFVSAGNSGLKIFNVSDSPAVLIGSIEINNTFCYTGVLNANESIFYLGETTGLSLIDVSQPDAPFLLSNLTLGSIFGIAQSPDGKLLYTAGGSGLQIIDVSNQTPSLMKSPLVLYGASIALNAEGTLAFLVSSNGLTLVDISNPVMPIIIRSLNYFLANGVVLNAAEQWAYVATNSGLRIVEINYNPYATFIAFSNNMTYNTTLQPEKTNAGTILLFDDKGVNAKPEIREACLVNENGQLRSLPPWFRFNKTTFEFSITVPKNWPMNSLILQTQFWSEFFANIYFSVNASSQYTKTWTGSSVTPSIQQNTLSNTPSSLSFSSTLQQPAKTPKRSSSSLSISNSTEKNSRSLTFFSTRSPSLGKVDRSKTLTSQSTSKTLKQEAPARVLSPLELLIDSKTVEVVTKVAVATTVASGVLSTIATNKATTASRISSVAHCAFVKDEFELNELLYVLTFPLSLGNSEEEIARINGAILSTTGLMTLTLATLIASGYLKDANSPGRMQKFHKMVSILFTLMLSYYGPNVIEIATLSAGHYTSSDRALAIGALSFWSALFLWAGYQLFQKSSEDAPSSIDLSPLYEPTRDFTRRITRVVVLEDIAVANLLAMLAGLKPNHQSCRHVALAMLVISTANFGYLVKTKPYKLSLEQRLMVINALFQLALSSLSLASTYTENETLQTSLGITELGSFSFLYLQTLLLTLAEIKQMIKKYQEKPQDANAMNGLQTPLIQMQPVANPLAVLNVPEIRTGL